MDVKYIVLVLLFQNNYKTLEFHILHVFLIDDVLHFFLMMMVLKIHLLSFYHCFVECWNSYPHFHLQRNLLLNGLNLILEEEMMIFIDFLVLLNAYNLIFGIFLFLLFLLILGFGLIILRVVTKNLICKKSFWIFQSKYGENDSFASGNENI